jgi:hypothetical protein
MKIFQLRQHCTENAAAKKQLQSIAFEAGTLSLEGMLPEYTFLVLDLLGFGVRNKTYSHHIHLIDSPFLVDFPIGKISQITD